MTEQIDLSPDGPVEAAKNVFRPLIGTPELEEQWPGFSLEEFGIAMDRRVFDNGDELVVFVPYASRVIHTVETGFRPAVIALRLRMRPTPEGWEFVGVHTEDEP